MNAKKEANAVDSSFDPELESLRKELGIRIKQIRLDITKFSRDAFGKEVGVAISTVQRWEEGTREPDGIMLGKIARKYGVRLDWLLYGEGPMLVSEIENTEEQRELAGVDTHALQQIFESLERFEQASNRIYTPERKALIVSHLYKNYDRMKDVLDIVLEGILKAAA